MEMVQMTEKMLKEYRAEVSKQQKSVCPVCKKKRMDNEWTVDHQHKAKDAENGINGNGMVRGVICFMCNSTEGRILSRYKRSGLAAQISYSDFLRNLADYLDQPVTHYIHPSEKPKEPKLSKAAFKKIQKLYAIDFPKKKLLDFPKSGKASKLIKELALKYKIEKLYLKG